MSIRTFAHSLKLDPKNGDLVYFDDSPEEQKKFLKRLKQNRLFKLLNLVETTHERGGAMGLFTPIAGTTDTDREDRKPKQALAPYQQYHCEQINIDSFITYSQMDQHNVENDQGEYLNKLLDKATLKGLLMVGWNGTGRNGTSNPEQNPLAQDVKVGWLEKIRTGKPQAIINGASVGKTGAYKSLNALMKHALTQITPSYASGGDMIAICGREIIGDSLIQFEQADFEDLAELLTLTKKTIGGVKAVSIPYFPSNAILLTPLHNLSLYIHLNNIRRRVIDRPERDALMTFFSFNADYVVEDFNACFLIENIELIEE
ncbi:capsid protein [Haemophilus paracuniculus]|uniref:Capsid protein n=1 Tax=Haemophilus paracuniculus TaxID=734 RepID=A0A1T0AR97_9PAST|nr:P2 family phage major capsid protein [Haemophilus paracuniculus]OOR98867.1 capsid protein [Haemophilus paracuniculus]